LERGEGLRTWRRQHRGRRKGAGGSRKRRRRRRRRRRGGGSRLCERVRRWGQKWGWRERRRGAKR